MLLYEDDPVLRKQLEDVFYSIREQYRLIASFSDARDITSHVTEFNPDAILLDIQMLDVDDGLMALYQVRQLVSPVKVMMLTMFDDDDKIFHAICLGANGYMLKSDFSSYQLPHEAIRKSLSIIFENGAYLTPSVAAKILLLFSETDIGAKVNQVKARFRNLVSRISHKPADAHVLTKMQTLVLHKIAEGKTTAQIAAECRLSENTINSHIKAVYSILEVHSRSHAIRKAVENKLVRLTGL